MGDSMGGILYEPDKLHVAVYFGDKKTMCLVTDPMIVSEHNFEKVKAEFPLRKVKVTPCNLPGSKPILVELGKCEDC